MQNSYRCCVKGLRARGGWIRDTMPDTTTGGDSQYRSLWVGIPQEKARKAGNIAQNHGKYKMRIGWLWSHDLHAYYHYLNWIHLVLPR